MQLPLFAVPLENQAKYMGGESEKEFQFSFCSLTWAAGIGGGMEWGPRVVLLFPGLGDQVDCCTGHRLTPVGGLCSAWNLQSGMVFVNSSSVY